MQGVRSINLVENRGSGIRTMIKSLTKANLEPPYFQDKRSSFRVTLKNHTLINNEAIEWLNQYASLPLNDRQRLALVYLRHRHQITNSEYQRLNCIDSVTATKELRSLVQCGLVEQRNTRRWAYYTFKIPVKVELVQIINTPEEIILEYIRNHGHIKRAECQKLLTVNEIQARYILQKMKNKGLLKLEGLRKGAKYILS